MAKAHIVYFSSSGNTEAMANFIAEGVRDAGGEAQVTPVDTASPSDLDDAAAFALGSPACGTEELDDSYMEGFVSELEAKVSGKKILLFGSHDWGDGEFMRTWQARMEAAGASILTGEGIITVLEPDEEAADKLRAAGAELAKLLA